MIFKRYSDPLRLIDNMIRTGQYHDFVVGVIDIYNEENDDKALWEAWLHKSFDKTFAEFVECCKGTEQQEDSKEKTLETVNESFDILNHFIPH